MRDMAHRLHMTKWGKVSSIAICAIELHLMQAMAMSILKVSIISRVTNKITHNDIKKGLVNDKSSFIGL